MSGYSWKFGSTWVLLVSHALGLDFNNTEVVRFAFFVSSSVTGEAKFIVTAGSCDIIGWLRSMAFERISGKNGKLIAWISCTVMPPTLRATWTGNGSFCGSITSVGLICTP